MRAVYALAAAGLLQACVTTNTVHYFDEECRVEARKIVLDVESVMAVNRCTNQECLAQVVAVATVGAASAIVAGSIAVVGNVIYWMEKEQNCRKVKAQPAAPAGSAPA